MKHSHKRGKIAEIFAAVFLIFKGYKIIKRRYKTSLGEIDIIAKKGKTIVFIEIKLRKTINDALESLLSSQKQRIINAALSFMSKYNCDQVRFDVIALSPFKIPKHIKNAFNENDF